jgi:hypothetical protein
MKDWRLMKFNKLLEESTISDESGQSPKIAKYEKIFCNWETGEVKIINDLQSKKYKRNSYLDKFCSAYKNLYKEQKISILTAVANQSDYKTIGSFIDTITKKLGRKGIARLGYIWVRDIGDIKFEKHYHIVIATERIIKATFYGLFNKKNHSRYEIKFVDRVNGIKKYLKKKELFGAGKERSFGKSKQFLIKRKIP